MATQRGSNSSTAFAVDPYRVEYAVRVWAQLDALQRGVRDRIGAELQALAELAAQAPLPPEASTRLGTSLCFYVGEAVVTYEVSESRRVITVLEVARRSE